MIPPTSVADTRGEMLHFEDGSWMTVWPSDRRDHPAWYREACNDAVQREWIPDTVNTTDNQRAASGESPGS